MLDKTKTFNETHEAFIEAYRQRVRDRERAIREGRLTVMDFTGPDKPARTSIGGYDRDGNFDPYLNHGNPDCEDGNGI